MLGARPRPWTILLFKIDWKIYFLIVLSSTLNVSFHLWFRYRLFLSINSSTEQTRWPCSLYADSGRSEWWEWEAALNWVESMNVLNKRIYQFSNYFELPIDCLYIRNKPFLIILFLQIAEKLFRLAIDAIVLKTDNDNDIETSTKLTVSMAVAY